MKESIIKISLNDFAFNAGVYGLYYVLKWAGKDILEFTREHRKVSTDGDSMLSLYLPEEYLDDFVENYYGYLIDKYLNQISYGKIISFRETANEILNSDSETTLDNNIKITNDYVDKVLKYYFKSNSYTSAFKLIEQSDDLETRVKNITKLKIKTSDTNSDKKEQLNLLLKEILEILDIFEKNSYKRYIGSKNIIYSVIKNNWDGVSVLNKQVKEPDVYIELNNYFLTPLYEYLSSDKDTYKFNCCSCDRPIKNLDNTISFLTNTGFDTARKSSYVYNFINDQGICPICKFIYMCMPAGFSYTISRGMGIFLNSSSTVDSLINANNNLHEKVNDTINSMERTNLFKKIVTSVNDSFRKGVEYSLSDVQFVIFENERYKFSILSDELLYIINNSEEDLKKLENASYKEGKKTVYIYELVLKQILNNQNLFLTLNKLIRYRVSRNDGIYYNMGHLYRMLNINLNFMKGVGLMSEINMDDIKGMRNVGWHVREEYIRKNSVKKLDGITYKLLNALKTSNSSEFLDVLIRCYMYIGKQIPKIVTEYLGDEEKFKTTGYAFIIGLNGVNKTNLENNDKESMLNN